MAKLPNITEDRQVAQAGVNQGIRPTQLDISPVTEANNQLGASLQKAGNAAIEADNHIQRFNYALSKSRITRENANLLNRVEQDINNTGDYATAQTNYENGLKDISENLSKDINHPAYKSKLNKDVTDLKNNTALKIQQLQEKAQQAQSYALANQELDNTVESVINTRDPIEQEKIIKAGLAPIVAAIPNSDPDKALKIAKVEEEYKKRIGVGVFNSLPPKEQLDALNSYDNNYKAGKSVFSTVGYIAPEDRPIYRKRAEQAIEQQKDNAIATIRQNDFLKERQAKENALQSVINGGSVAQIPIQQYARLSDSERSNLNKIQQIQSGLYQIDPVEGIKAYNKYSQLYSVDPSEFAKVDPIEIRANVVPDKVDKVIDWQQKAMQGIPQNAAEKNFNGTANFYVTKVLKKKFDEPDAALFINKFREAKQEFVDSKGKQPNNEELRYIANGLVAQEAVDGILWGTNKKPLYKMTGKEEAPDDKKNEIVKQARAKDPNITLTNEQINQLYFENISKKPIK